jgi:hypothetical protein
MKKVFLFVIFIVLLSNFIFVLYHSALSITVIQLIQKKEHVPDIVILTR